MIWLLEIYAALEAGFGFLAHNYAQCSSTQILQFTVLAAAGLAVARIGLRSAASERMRRRLAAVDLRHEPALAAALDRASRIVGPPRPVACYWAEEGGVQIATLGYFRPCLIVSRSIAEALAADELEAALAHELLHMRRRDALRVDLGRALFTVAVLSAGFALLLFLAFYVGAFGMNRLLALSAVAGGLLLVSTGGRRVGRWLERRAEFACDRAAARGRGGALAVAAALVKVARLEMNVAHRGPVAAMPLLSAETFHLRVRRLMEAEQGAAPRKPSRHRWRIAGAAVLGLAGPLLTQPLNMKEAAAAGCMTCGLVLKKAAHWSD